MDQVEWRDGSDSEPGGAKMKKFLILVLILYPCTAQDQQASVSFTEPTRMKRNLPLDQSKQH
jgi:hypothetical protein